MEVKSQTSHKTINTDYCQYLKIRCSLVTISYWFLSIQFSALVSQIKKAGDKKVQREREMRFQVEEEIEKYRTHSFAQEAYIKHLQELLRENHITYKDEYRSPFDTKR